MNIEAKSIDGKKARPPHPCTSAATLSSRILTPPHEQLHFSHQILAAMDVILVVSRRFSWQLQPFRVHCPSFISSLPRFPFLCKVGSETYRLPPRTSLSNASEKQSTIRLVSLLLNRCRFVTLRQRTNTAERTIIHSNHNAA